MTDNIAVSDSPQDYTVSDLDDMASKLQQMKDTMKQRLLAKDSAGQATESLANSGQEAMDTLFLEQHDPEDNSNGFLDHMTSEDISELFEHNSKEVEFKVEPASDAEDADADPDGGEQTDWIDVHQILPEPPAGQSTNFKKRGRPKKINAGIVPKTNKRKAQHNKLGNANINHLTGTDIYKDVSATAHLPVQLATRAGANRQDALRLLRQDIASNNLEDNARDDKLLEHAMKQFDGRSVAFAESGLKVAGIKTLLHPYQVVGTGFMRQREKADGSGEARGGILADTMGLGKTLMMLANIVNGQPKTVRDRKPTLIVASPALVEQWHAEAGKHAVEITKENRHSPGLRRVVLYRNFAKLPLNEQDRNIQGADIVLATYHMVARSYPKGRPPHDCQTAEQKQAWFAGYFRSEAGFLHRVSWHRVVLDEAHAIKNFASLTSRACRTLKAKFYWAITGTPILNSIIEFYPYLRFIRDPLVTSLPSFTKLFCDTEDEESCTRLRVLLDRIMLRRTHASTMFGARLVTLPDLLPCLDISVKFSPFEQKIYDIVRNRFIQRIESCVKSDDSDANKHRHVFAMILRLRQLTGHVLLLEDILSDLLTLHDIHHLQSWCNQLKQNETDQNALQAHLQLLAMLDQASATKALQMKQNNQKLVQSKAPFVDANQFTYETFTQLGLDRIRGLQPEKIVDGLRNRESMIAITARTKCAACHSKPSDPHVTSCNHVYCLDCVQHVQDIAARFARDYAVCAECQAAFTSVRRCEELPEEDEDEEQEGFNDLDAVPKRAKRKAKLRMIDWTRGKGRVPPSAKTQAMKAQVARWLSDDADIKIIIYSQFVPLLRIIGRICQSEKWTYVKYQGDMTAEARAKAVQRFSDPKEKVQIFLASLKCGGQGLNLTAAARVILMDSWWNDSVEQQAFSRVYRIGQEKATQMTRLLVENTIDENMFTIKDRKQKEIEPVVDGPAGSGKMSLEELISAVGPVSHDDKGRPYLSNNRRQDGEEVSYADLHEPTESFLHRA